MELIIGYYYKVYFVYMHIFIQTFKDVDRYLHIMIIKRFFNLAILLLCRNIFSIIYPTTN